jgi:hypothetical protein
MAPIAVLPSAAPIAPTAARDYPVADDRAVMAITGMLLRNLPLSGQQKHCGIDIRSIDAPDPRRPVV